MQEKQRGKKTMKLRKKVWNGEGREFQEEEQE